MSAEMIISFRTIDDLTVEDLGRLFSARLEAFGIECSRPDEFGLGVRFSARVGGTKFPVLIGRASGSDRHLLSIGSAVLPIARLLGAKDRSPRDRVIAAVGAIIESAPELTEAEYRPD